MPFLPLLKLYNLFIFHPIKNLEAFFEPPSLMKSDILLTLLTHFLYLSYELEQSVLYYIYVMHSYFSGSTLTEPWEKRL